jgi:uncharacterized repeat protein (TIGR02543 family)
VNASGQQRPFLKLDPTLSEVARQRAQDMAQRDYFAHVDPDGNGPNYYVEQAGYDLPELYGDSRSGNYIESIAAGRPTAGATWNDFMASPPHKTHLLAEDPFYQEQTSYGIGYAYDASSKYRYYWVVITAPPRPVPSLRITSPRGNALLKTATVNVTGTAGGPIIPKEVLVRIENAVGGTQFQAASGTARWSISLSNLQPGANTIRVRSVDASGATIVELTRRVHYVVLAPLTVEVNGLGKVTSAFAGLTQRQVGMRYTVVARPAPGYLFAGWTGDLTGPDEALTFTMPAAMSLVANFVPNPFVSRKGTYTGVVSTGEVSGVGIVTATVGSNGTVSGKVRVGSLVSPFKLRLGLDGTGTVTVSTKDRAALTLQLALDLIGSDGLRVTVANGATTYNAVASRAARGSELGVRHGLYSLSLPADESRTDGTFPQGSGYGTLVVNASGRAVVVGQLADGQRFTHATFVTESGMVPVFASLYEKTGFVAGELHFRTTETEVVDGVLDWRKPPQPTDRTYPAGFAATIRVVGSYAEGVASN